MAEIIPRYGFPIGLTIHLDQQYCGALTKEWTDDYPKLMTSLHKASFENIVMFNKKNRLDVDRISCFYQAAKLDRLPDYLRDTVDWFIGKARRKEKEGADSSSSDSKLYLEATVLERKLPEMDMKLLVDLPAGLDYNEWLASHTMALFEHVNLVYGAVSEFCTTNSCPDMTGPGQRTYLWFDEKGKKTKVAAPQYIDYVMTFIQKTISDETIFPTKYANEFPSSFESIVRKIVRLLFHVVAHLYAAHFKEVVMLGLHSHLNQTFVHLTALHHRFSLIDPKETEILKDLEVALGLNEDSQEVANNNEKKEESEDSKTQSTEDTCGDNKS